ncbi:hypothetical protein LZ198_28235 [Myxococcus sp. K15C18031901]|uniref:hypothetical protein n=1 Tax=Myxococcus dinghuensis TaxID=2906761 RepID=UPI0020A7C5F2|nr:hypothetical protein [Myxococcus dinghuensis]MCP3102772.1 hypothetical protein [Myxococcus dinghuensis]
MTDWIPKPNPQVNLRSLVLSPEEGFVLSRLDGATAARNLPALTGLPPERLQGILTRLVAEGALLPATGAEPPPPRPPVHPGDEPTAQTGHVARETPPPEEPLPPLELEGDTANAEPSDATADDAEPEPEEDVPEVALGNFRQLFETRLHPQPEDQRVAQARGVEDPELSAFCFDPVPAVIKAVLENPRTGLAHARLIARNHRNPVGLEALCARAAFAADTGVRRWLVRNPQLPAGLFRRLWSARRLMELHKVTNDRDVPESTRRSAREVLRQRFTTGPSEEKVELILNTEGRALNALLGLSVDGKTTSLLCGRTYRSPLLIQNIARWSAAPPALITHLLKQEAVRRQPQLRMMLARHPNAPADVKRGG